MKKMNLNKRSTEFGTFHEHENEMNSNYDSLGDSYNNEKQTTNESSNSSEKEECHDLGCHSTRSQKSNR